MRTLLLAAAVAVAAIAYANGTTLSRASAGGSLYGFSTKGYLVKVNPTTGAQTNVGYRYPNELSAQQLATIDLRRQIYYLLDFNISSRKVQLVGLNLADGSVRVDLTIDLQESAFVGVGQSVDVDILTGNVVINGHDATVQGHHIFYINPLAANPIPVSVAKIPAPKVYLLGGSSAVDWNLGIFYSPLVLPPADGSAEPWDDANEYTIRMRGNGIWSIENQDGQPPPPKFRVELVGVHYTSASAPIGTMKIIPQTYPLGTLVYDFHPTTPAIVGFSGKESASGTYEKTLVRVTTADKGATYSFKEIGVVEGYLGEMGPISTVDSVNRVHYSLLQPPQKSTWEPSTNCTPTCKTGTSCCRSPPSGPACFTVPSCSKMPSPPDMDAPFYVVGVNLDTAKVLSAGKICAISTNDCPWSLEFDGSMTSSVTTL